MKPIRASNYVFMSDLLNEVINRGMGQGRTVTPFVLDSASAAEVHFEVRVTRVGKSKVPRITAEQAAKARAAR